MFTFIDLFAGIGGFKIGCEQNGGKSLGFSEVNKKAIATYCQNFNEKESNNFGDITKIKSLPQCDILTGGVPCQSWSIAGKRKGFDDERGQLWNDAIKMLSLSNPKVFIFENVKGLYDTRNANALAYILEQIRNAGYFSKVFLLNSYDFGLPQKRERLYIIGFKKELYANSFNINGKNNKLELNDFLDETQNITSYADCFSLNDIRDGTSTLHSWDINNISSEYKNICYLLLKNRRKSIYGKKDGNPLSLEDFKKIDSSITIEKLNKLCELNILQNIDSKYDFKNRKISTGINGVNRIFMPSSPYFSTLTSTVSYDYIACGQNVSINNKEDFLQFYKKNTFRQITKNEGLRIQGFPKNFILPENRTQWMKLLGNSVTPPVISDIIKQIITTGCLEK